MDEGIWSKAQGGDARALEEITTRFAPLVRYVVGRMRTTIPTWVDPDDLVSFGTLGLLDAIQRFEPARGLQFTTYAVRRIRGAVLDELRRTDWAPRRLRPEARAVQQAHEDLIGRFSRQPEPLEVAEALGWPLERVERVLADSRAALLHSLEGMQDETSADGDYYTSPEQPTDAAIGEDRMLEVESAGRLARALELMDDNERTLIALYYLEQVNFGEIADLLGVTESWVCQVYGRAMHSLRELTTI